MYFLKKKQIIPTIKLEIYIANIEVFYIIIKNPNY